MRAGHRSCVYYRSSFVSCTQGYQALYVFLELGLPLFSQVNLLAHKYVSAFWPRSVFAVIGGEACGCESPLEIFGTSQGPRQNRVTKLRTNIKMSIIDNVECEMILVSAFCSVVI